MTSCTLLKTASDDWLGSLTCFLSTRCQEFRSQNRINATQRETWTICVFGCLVVSLHSLITDQSQQHLSWRLQLLQQLKIRTQASKFPATMCYPLQSYARESKMHWYTRRIKPDYSAVGNHSEPIDDNLICVFVNQSHPKKRATAWTWKCVEWANRHCCFKLFKCCAQWQTNLTGFCSLIR